MDLSLLKNWWWLTVNGIAAMVFGLAAILYPNMTLVLLLGYFGMLALFLGALFMLGGYLNRKQTNLWYFWFFEGILNSSIGLVLLFYNNVSLPMFQILLSIWAILVGAIQIVTVLKIWQVVHNRWLYLINGSLGLLFGILVVTIPFVAVEKLTVMVGGYAVVLGLFSILISISLKHIKLQDLKDQTEVYKYHHQ